MKKLLLFLVASVLFAAGSVAFALNRQYSLQNVQGTEVVASPAASPMPVATASVTPVASASTPSPTATPAALPASFSIAVPYTLQSPFNKWDAVHEDACEETSLIMVKHFLDGTAIGTPEQVDKEITDLVAWEEHHGYGPSITLAQLNQIAVDYYGLKSGHVVPATSYVDLQKEVAAGHPVIVGLAGKLLPNPYFSNGGPVYHMLVVKGYDATGFLTNEPGTWHGDGYHYNFPIFFTATHDWNSQDILEGHKAYLVFK